ncbi:MAG TPA: hypothetical protein DCQ92_05910 [Verrucomicrobia subdivision 3 bacterium]|nr:hypothetical protein [Limisphaerales bacterium]
MGEKPNKNLLDWQLIGYALPLLQCREILHVLQTLPALHDLQRLTSPQSRRSLQHLQPQLLTFEQECQSIRLMDSLQFANDTKQSLILFGRQHW